MFVAKAFFAERSETVSADRSTVSTLVPVEVAPVEARRPAA